MADTLAPLPGEEVVDASDCHITPGLIDAHSHICISEEGGGSEGDDCCDYSGTSTPELEVLDGLYPFDRAVKDCVRAGVTSCCVCPGSDGVVGGVASTIRLTGCVPDEMIVRRMTAMKCSVGENPKKANYSFCSRMGVAYQLRKSFDDALEYKYCKEEATKAGTHFHKDRGMEHMLLVLNKEMPVHMHAHRSDDICTAIRLAQEFDFDLVIIHGTDAIPIVDHLAKFDHPVIVGPSFNSRSKPELLGKTFATAGVLSRAGVKVCICSDHDVTPMYFLTTYVGLAVRYGMDGLEALKAVTVNPAQVLGIQDRKGELKVGLALRRPLLGMMGADDALYPLCEAYAIPVFLIIPLLILPRIWGWTGCGCPCPRRNCWPLGRPSTTSRQRRGYTTMAELERKGQDARFCEIMQRIGHLYEEYAKSKGMTYMSMCILEAICTHPDNCTQKRICEETHYPKQSMNLIIKSFLQAGYVTLDELPADRRNKHIILTEKGRDYAARTVTPLWKIDEESTRCLTAAQREELLRLLSVYAAAYEDGVKRAAGMP